MRSQRLAVILVLLGFLQHAAAIVPDVFAYFLANECARVPNRVDLEYGKECNNGCETRSDVAWKSVSHSCRADNYEEILWKVFDGSSFLVQEAYTNDCETRLEAPSLLASGSCEQVTMYVEEWGYALYAIIDASEMTSVQYFADEYCDSPRGETVPLTKLISAQNTTINPAILNTNKCDENMYRWKYCSRTSPCNSVNYVSGISSDVGSNSNTTSSAGSANPIATDDPDKKILPAESSASSNNVGLIVGIAGGVLAVILLVLAVLCYRRRLNRLAGGVFAVLLAVLAFVLYTIAGGIFVAILVVLTFVYYRRRSRSLDNTDHDTSQNEYLDQYTPAADQQQTPILESRSINEPQGQFGLWNDDIITAKRISRRDVQIQNLLSRGAFGEVYTGVFNDKRVAVKMLSPDTRGNMSHVNNFLAEAKMTASMDHPHIVHFIGVAWDSLSDLFVVMEYMEGGDLRTLLTEFETANRPTGIDREKATIAFHVCHALAYIHSLSPPVIHRDLKSRNILLNHAMEAKLSDFGISRERLNQTMTAGVGTSLWMAPEVMLGKKYDDKADMFSFGVVLSELDLHTLPYTQAEEKNRDLNGRKLPEAAILHQVVMGTLSVDFSEGPLSIAELGRACVSVDSTLRPTAAEALYKLQIALAQAGY
ncbi:serine/threonine protein kinase [Phytophthora nicotianae]|uniref:Serine/threonine protein kinase n=1 Tax=Phytophthora nicotianae TaxID=4792 RepID=W2P5L5_PHYNI|nr:serine/threonine protein kinase [Phytophthora nicotianae]